MDTDTRIETEDGPRPPFRKALETTLILDYLASHMKEPGNVVTYEDLSAVAGLDVQGQRGRAYMMTARRILLRQRGWVLKPHEGFGLKRLSENEIVAEQSSYTKRLRRQNRRAADELSVVGVDTLPERMKLHYYIHQSIRSLFDGITSKRIDRQLSSAVEKMQHALPPREMLRLFENGEVKDPK